MYNRYRLSDNFCWIIRSARRLFCSASCDLARGNPCPTAGEHNEIAISQRQREHGVAMALVVTVVVAVAAADGDKWATNHVKSERHCWQNNFSVSVRIWEQCRLPAWLVPWLTRWLADLAGMCHFHCLGSEGRGTRVRGNFGLADTKAGGSFRMQSERLVLPLLVGRNLLQLLS